MGKQKVAVTWEMCGYIEVEATNLEEAMRKVQDNPEDYLLPILKHYVDGSYQLTTDSVEEMEAMCRLNEYLR